jgi:hypothetical protein
MLAVQAAGVVLALVGAGLCWRTRCHGGSDRGDARAERGFVSDIGTALGLLFAAVIAAQGLAGLFFQVCER